MVRDSVVDTPPPPVEWVPAETRWWVIRVVVPVIVIAILLAILYLEWSANAGWATTHPLYAWGLVFSGLAVEYVFLFAFPSVRRIGISPLSLVVDVGFAKHTYSWTEVNSVTRTRVNRFRWNQLSSVSRTRISVGSGVFANWFELSPQQGDRLARFLRIP